jgi:hypothetical protein
MCGAVRFEAEPAERHSHACHCEMCRRWTGSAFVAVPVAPDALRLDGGETIRVYRSSDWAERAFCGLRLDALLPGDGRGAAGGDGSRAGALRRAGRVFAASELFIDASPRLRLRRRAQADDARPRSRRCSPGSARERGASVVRPATRRSAALMRVCQPLPPSLKCAITSGSSMMVTRRLRLSEGMEGRPPLRMNSAKSASSGISSRASPRAIISGVSSGASSSSGSRGRRQHRPRNRAS